MELACQDVYLANKDVLRNGFCVGQGITAWLNMDGDGLNGTSITYVHTPNNRDSTLSNRHTDTQHGYRFILWGYHNTVLVYST